MLVVMARLGLFGHQATGLWVKRRSKHQATRLWIKRRAWTGSAVGWSGGAGLLACSWSAGRWKIEGRRWRWKDMWGGGERTLLAKKIEYYTFFSIPILSLYKFPHWYSIKATLVSASHSFQGEKNVWGIFASSVYKECSSQSKINFSFYMTINRHSNDCD